MLDSPALVLSLAADTLAAQQSAPMSPPPIYPAPPSYRFGGSTDSLASGSNVTLEDLDLPDYDATPTLEPWLAPLRRSHWESSDLAIFLPSPSECATPDSESKATTPEELDWAHLRCALTTELIAHDLNADPCADVESDHMFDSIPRDVYRWIRDEIPAELQSVALTFACGSHPPERLVLSSLFSDALRRLTDHTLAHTHFDMDHPSTLPTHLPPHLAYLASTLPRAFYRLQLTALPTADLALLFKALFLLMCRVRFVRAARRRIADREHLLHSAIGRVFLGGHVWGPRWKGKEHNQQQHSKEHKHRHAHHENEQFAHAYEGPALGHSFA